jgi:para-aminobenzoate synthetase/4-amino-4-deoxychorismate lyase
LLDDARQDDDRGPALRKPAGDRGRPPRGRSGAALDRIAATPGWWAGALAYEAGLALEAAAGHARARSGAAGPLVWFARFARMTPLTSAGVATWLAAESGRSGGGGRLGPLGPAHSVGGYARAFAQVQEAIRAGDIYQANLTFQLAGSWAGDPLAIYAALRGDARGGHGAVLWDGSHWHLSVSPELFFEWRDDRVTVRPMKGTAPRGATAQEDEAFKQALAANPKDRAENLMIVDLMRNDLSRVAVPGTVKVREPLPWKPIPRCTRWSPPSPRVLARHAGGCAARDLPVRLDHRRAQDPAMEWIDMAERDARGLYCRSIGHVDVPAGEGESRRDDAPATGGAAFNVAIRTVRLVPDHPGAAGGRATMGVGSAVVADSTRLGEWRECVVKGISWVNAGHADLIETMAFDPAAGIVLLERHLERMKQSAHELGFAFDRHGVRNAIHACASISMPRPKCGWSWPAAAPTPWKLRPCPHRLAGRWPAPCCPCRSAATGACATRPAIAVSTKRACAPRRVGAQEALLRRDDGLLTEGCFTTLFVERDGVLVTPRAELGLLPGVLRSQLLEEGRAVEGDVRLDDLANGFFLGNAVRGLMPARLLGQG